MLLSICLLPLSGFAAFTMKSIPNWSASKDHPKGPLALLVSGRGGSRGEASLGQLEKVTATPKMLCLQQKLVDSVEDEWNFESLNHGEQLHNSHCSVGPDSGTYDV